MPLVAVSARSNSALQTHSSQLVRRRIVTHFTGGLEGLLRVVFVLRWRGYQVHTLSFDLRDGVTESSLLCTVMLASEHVDLLVARLRRLPSVVSAELA